MIKFIHKFEVIKPINDVFNLISDINNYNLWVASSNMVFIKTIITSKNREGMGLTFEDRVRLGGKSVGEIVKFVPPKQISIKQTTYYLFPFFTAHISYELCNLSYSTQVTHMVTAKAHGIFKLITPILKKFIVKERMALCHRIVQKFSESEY